MDGRCFVSQCISSFQWVFLFTFYWAHPLGKFSDSRVEAES
jgi:hypothetical protein